MRASRSVSAYMMARAAATEDGRENSLAETSWSHSRSASVETPRSIAGALGAGIVRSVEAVCVRWMVGCMRSYPVLEIGSVGDMVAERCGLVSARLGKGGGEERPAAAGTHRRCRPRR